MKIKSDRFLAIVLSEWNRLVAGEDVSTIVSDTLLRPTSADEWQRSAEHPITLATLPLAAYEAVGGGDASAVAQTGAAMEFLLTAGDILDDLQDGDLRYGGSGAHEKYVEKIEQITTLLLFAEYAITSVDPSRISTRRILRSLAIFSRFKINAFGAQLADAHAHDNESQSPFQILERTKSKSGSLGKCAGLIGATLATDDPDSIRMAGAFGEHLAIVYQLKNDIGDLWPNHGNMDDAVSGKATAPTAFSLAVGDGESGSTALSSVLSGKSSHSVDIEAARKETFESGGMHFAMIQAFAHLSRARSLSARLADKHRTLDMELTLNEL